VIADAVHVSIARSKRGQRPRTGVQIHTLARPLEPHEIRDTAGVQATSPERTLVDSVEDGPSPEQIELAIRQALGRGLTTSRRLREAAATRSSRTRELVDDAVSQVQR